MSAISVTETRSGTGTHAPMREYLSTVTSAVSKQQPQRIQRSRRSGWRMPPSAIYVGRPTGYGNPFEFARFGRGQAVELFRRWLGDDLTPSELQVLFGVRDGKPVGRAELVNVLDELHRRRVWIVRHLGELAGKHLACWCGSREACHADVLLDLANRGGE